MGFIKVGRQGEKEVGYAKQEFLEKLKAEKPEHQETYKGDIRKYPKE